MSGEPPSDADGPRRSVPPPLPPTVPDAPTRPASPVRRLLGVGLGIVIEGALCAASFFVLGLAGPKHGGAGLSDIAWMFGLAQIVPALPIAFLCWRNDLKGTAISLAVTSAVVFLIVGGGGLALWVACGQGRGWSH